MKNNLIDEIVSLTNLYWAWEKAKWFYKPGDIWFDEIEVLAFEANISEELLKIREEIISGKYRMKPIKPVAFPKKVGQNGQARTRQTFWVSVRDQVTWLAVANKIGSQIDYKMPFWSYGNRLYISAFYEENRETTRKELKFGFYRNTSKYTFRKWSQSWPLYRRHICLSSKFLTTEPKKIEFEDDEKESLDINDSLVENHPLKVEYLNADYWPSKNSGKLFWAGLDLEKFYPNLRVESINQNIKRNVTNGNDLFHLLIDELLKFRLDLSGWSKEELKEIQIEIDTNIYDGVPTGLFVGGFLANIALLEIDKKVTEKLRQNKKVAHFRYVDDHVVISNSFDQLINWIEEYEFILKKSNVFKKDPINATKTEPEALGEYFKLKNENSINDEELLVESFEKAKASCEVDPEFPSPLMTQTLSKVSKIAGTEFQLLDPEEQKGLISDIEHLLITEFPDNELRRDTRVSFAATMLTNFVPKISIDESKNYELNKKIIQLSEEKKTLKRKNENEKLNEIGNNIKILENQLSISKNEIAKEEKKIILKTVKLLKKAVRENHDKVRLWTRLVEFSYKSGGQIEEQIFEEIQKLLENRISNKLSITYIQSLLLQVLNNQLISAYKVIIDDKSLYKYKERAKKFLEGILEERLLSIISSMFNNSLKFYETISLDTFKFTVGTIIYLVQEKELLGKTLNGEKLIIDNGLIHWKHYPKNFCNKTSYSFEAWVWWFINKSSNFDDLAPPEIWSLAINQIDVFDSLGQAIISKYPKHLTPNVIYKIDREFQELTALQNEGWILDVKRGIKQRQLNIQPTFSNQLIEKENKHEDYLTIDQWISWTNSKYSKTQYESDNGLIFDPRLGEWMALEIIAQIADVVSKKVQKIEFNLNFENLENQQDYISYIHPNNFKISKRLIEQDSLTWDELRSLIRGNNVSFVDDENFVYDQRFNSMIRFSHKYEQKIESALNSIGAILVCLLHKNLDLPNKWNPEGHQFIWLNLMNRMLKEVPVSSYTRDIISGCFSKRNIETKQLLKDRISLQLRAEDDFKKDPPSFVSITDFIDYVRLSQLSLLKQQISVSENQPRQLIPISLKQMTNNQYQKLIEEIE